MLGDKKLSELVNAHKELRIDLSAIQDSVEGCEAAIKTELIALGATEALTVNWSRLRRMVKN